MACLTMMTMMTGVTRYLLTPPVEQEDPSPPHWPHWSSLAPEPTTRSQPTLCNVTPLSLEARRGECEVQMASG